MKPILLLLVGLPHFIAAQTKLSISSACSYFGESLPADIYSFSPDDEAKTALARITSASGIPMNFQLIAGNVPNACAILKWNSYSQGYDRIIIYNQTFMQRLANATNDWAALSIIAHEVGHHLSGHSLKSGGSKPELELEADKFSGFILARLGASMQQAQLAINTIVTENYSTTHPPKSARLAAVANGWIEGGSKNGKKSNVVNTSATGKPDLRSYEVCKDLILKKSESGGYWLYHPATEYYLKKDEDYIPFWIGPSMVIYVPDSEHYFVIEDYDNLSVNSEKAFKYVTIFAALYIKAANNGYWLYYKGKPVEDIEIISYDGNIGQEYGYVVLRSKSTGRRFWVHQSKMYYGAQYSMTGVYSE
jgi:hypothetical protein